MDFYKRLGMYFFAIGALLSILAGAFPISDQMFSIVTITLIFLGVFSAILNVEEEEELALVVAGAGFLIAIFSFQYLLGDNALVAGLAQFFKVVTLFIGSMLGTVALKTVIEFGSQAEGNPLGHADDVSDHVESLLYSKAEKSWHLVVFIGVAISFIQILLEVFFSLQEYAQWFLGLDILVTVIFFVDLIILYKREGSFGRFLRHCWLDIVATIPFYNVFRVVKLARLLKMTKFMKLNKTLKFFSERSGVRHYINAASNVKEQTMEHEGPETKSKYGSRKRSKK